MNKWAQAPKLEHCALLPVPLNSRRGPSRKARAEAIHPCHSKSFLPAFIVLHKDSSTCTNTGRSQAEGGTRHLRSLSSRACLILSQKWPHLHMPHLMRQPPSPHAFEPLKCSRTMQLCFFENRLGGEDNKVHFQSKMTFWCKDSEIWRVRQREREPLPHRHKFRVRVRVRVGLGLG